MIAKLLPPLFLLIFFSTMSAQTPSIEPGVSQSLAKWRAANYSDVRYKLNLTLEKMSPVLKGTIEIRVKVRDEESKSSPPYEGGVDAALGGRGGSLIILDWRKIRGSENLSIISNVSINGVRVTPLGVKPAGEAPNANNTPAPAQNPTSDSAALITPKGVTLTKGVTRVYEENNEHLVFRDGVVAGENVIKVDFTSPILTSGSAITRYVDKEDGSEYIYSLFVPSDASTAFPVFDQPDLKAKFDLSVNAPGEWKIVSNSAVAGVVQPYCGPPSEINIETGRAGAILPYTKCGPITGFYETKPISTYVFAFAAGPFEKFSDVGGNPSGSEGARGRSDSRSGTLPTGRVSPSDAGSVVGSPHVSKGSTRLDSNVEPSLTVGLPTHVYVRKSQAEKFKPHAAEVFRLNREGIKFLEEYFDYKFPFPKYDIVLIPEFPFGGMEHAGATFLREDRVIFPTEPTKNDYITRANVIFHEAAHQWFGDTVTMRWFDDLWLKEGFAEFMAYKTLEKVMPEYNAWKVFYERNKQAAYLTDSTKGTTPIYQEIPNLSAAKSAYGNIVYRKAPSFLKQAEFYIGPDKFQTAVRAFLKKHEFGNAEWTDLVKEFETASGQDLKNWSDTWVTKRGLPKIRFSTHSSNGKSIFIAARQESVLNDPTEWDMQFKSIVLFSDGKREPINSTFNGGYSQIFHGSSDFAGILPNYQDYGYGIFLLDDKSRDYVLKNIQNEKDDFLRTMMWGSLWDSVREAELDPKEYIELVINNLSVRSSDFSRPSAAEKPAKAGTPNVETDESTIATLLNRVSTAMTYYVSEAQRDELAPKVEAMLIDRLKNAPTLGQRITYYRAFLNIASTESARKVLIGILTAETPRRGEGKSEPGAVATGSTASQKIPLKTKDRFDIVTRLLILNDPDAPKLLADLEKTETSDEAKRYAYAAKAGIATAENKTKFWNDFVSNKQISESWIEAAFGPFNSVRHADLTLPYLEKALKELPNHKRNRKIFFVNGWLAAFIGGQKSEEALGIVNKFLAVHPDLDKDLRLKILENVDVIERAVKIRKSFARK